MCVCVFVRHGSVHFRRTHMLKPGGWSILCACTLDKYCSGNSKQVYALPSVCAGRCRSCHPTFAWLSHVVLSQPR